MPVTRARPAAGAPSFSLAGDEGSGLIELALTMPVFLLMVFGFVSFALVVYGGSNITYASRMALRYAQTHSSTSYTPATDAQLKAMMTPFFPGFPSNSTSVIISHSQGQAVGQSICIGVSVTYNIVLPGYTHGGPTIPTVACGVIVQ